MGRTATGYTTWRLQAASQIADRLRLEKERISFGWLHRALASFDR
jgi:hypothetical protein